MPEETKPQPTQDDQLSQKEVIAPNSNTEQQSPKKSPLIPILITIIIILLGVVGFFAYQYFIPQDQLIISQAQPATSPTPQSTTPPTPTTSSEAQIEIDPTSDWNSYTDDTMKLTFKYPSDWSYHYLDESAPSIMVAPEDIVDKIKNAPGGFGGGPFLTMIISLHDYDPTPKTDEFTSVVSKPTTIDSKEFTHYTSTYLQSGPGFSKGDAAQDYLMKSGEKWIKIGLLDSTKKEILDQIVSSIKFIE